MPHLDFVALREPVTCTLPTDEPGRKRLVRQFRRLELEQYEQAVALNTVAQVSDDPEAIREVIDAFDDLCRFAVEGIEDRELAALTTVDKLRLLAGAVGKLEMVEAALKNVGSGGDASTKTASPPLDSLASTPTTDGPPLSAG